MKETRKPVRTKGKIVSEVDVPVYDSVEEIINSEPSERIVAVFNNGNAVRIMGNERAKFSGVRTGKKKRMQIAFGLLTTEEMMSVAGDGAALESLLESDEIQARVTVHLEETEGVSDDADDADDATETE